MNPELPWPEKIRTVPALTIPDVDGFFRRRVFALLTQLTECELTVIEAGHAWRFGDSAGPAPLKATLHIRDPELYRQLVTGGSVGVAEAYISGDWVADDLVALVRIFVRNRALLDRMEGGLASVGAWALAQWHRFRRNTRDGARKNIAAHYDLGNAMFELFLDRTMMYSSAIYTHEDESLETAQLRRLDRICQKLDLKPGMSLVEIGTGWGGFALHAAQHYGARVTTTTISAEQYQRARERVAEAGLTDRVNVVMQDYRDLRGEYDRLVSIEMIEAIGHQYLGAYFNQVSRLLKPDGLALIQAITIEDHRYEVALKAVDFIKRYIFPGSFIPSISAMLSAAAGSGDLKLSHLEDIGPSYALTLRAWRQRFHGNEAKIRELGYSPEFVRQFDYYFAYCEGGFLERSIGDVQMLLAKPRNVRRQYLPDLKPSI